MTNTLWHQIVRWGFSGAVAAYLVYNLVETQKAYAVQLKDLNGQLLHLSQVVSAQGDVTTSTTIVLRQICVNGARTEDARRVCLQ